MSHEWCCMSGVNRTTGSSVIVVADEVIRDNR